MTEQPDPLDPLDQFLAWFLNHGTVLGRVPLFSAVSKIEGVTRVVWYRDPPFQVELFIAPPGCIIPEHTHPNVDSYEIYIGGQIRFSHSGKFIVPEEDIETPTESGASRRRGYITRVRPDDPHGGTFGPGGGVFFSVQHWLNGVDPHSVANDYSGAVMGPDHYSQVKAGEPVLKDSLTAQDAATRE